MKGYSDDDFRDEGNIRENNLAFCCDAANYVLKNFNRSDFSEFQKSLLCPDGMELAARSLLGDQFDNLEISEVIYENYICNNSSNEDNRDSMIYRITLRIINEFRGISEEDAIAAAETLLEVFLTFASKIKLIDRESVFQRLPSPFFSKFFTYNQTIVVRDEEIMQEVQGIEEYSECEKVYVQDWFNNMNAEELRDIFSKDNAIEVVLKSMGRFPGGLHEWLMVCSFVKLRELGVKWESIKLFRTKIAALRFKTNEAHCGVHGGPGSGHFHNVLLEYINLADNQAELAGNLFQFKNEFFDEERFTAPEELNNLILAFGGEL